MASSSWRAVSNVTRCPASAFLIVRALRLRVLRDNASCVRPKVPRIARSLSRVQSGSCDTPATLAIGNIPVSDIVPATFVSCAPVALRRCIHSLSLHLASSIVGMFSSRTCSSGRSPACFSSSIHLALAFSSCERMCRAKRLNTSELNPTYRGLPSLGSLNW